MTVSVEYHNRSYTSIAKGNQNHFKVIQQLSKKKTTASNVPIVAIDVTTSLSLTGNRDWVLCIEYEVFI